MNFRFFNHRLFSALLNFIGLALAFSAFLVIMVQVVYDYGYDRNYEDAGRIFRVENKFMSRTGYSTALSRPIIEAMKSASPEIEAGGCYNYSKGWNVAVSLADDGQQNEYRARYGIIEKSLLKVFPFDFITGDTSRFEPFTVIISESTAKLLFGDESAVGKNIYLDKGEQPYMVAAVYKDFPENSSADCGIFSNMGDSQIDNWSEWNMSFYVKLRSPQAAGDVATAMLQSLMSYYDAESWTEEEMAEYMSSLRLVNLHDAYYSTDVEYDNMGKG
ncbi:MAG: ABC transporter permease, partial [Muribaculum sp.]|nr:ABC transporter permease [Candidatus Merdivivens faecigallinarum]